MRSLHFVLFFLYWQNRPIYLAGLAGCLAVLASEEAVSVSLFAEIFEFLACSIRAVVVPSPLRLSIVSLAVEVSK